MAKKSKHVTFQLPIEVDNLPKQAVSKTPRHAACKLPSAVENQPKRLPVSIKLNSLPTAIENKKKRLPVSIKLDSSADGIVVEVKRVKADVKELQKNLAEETAARNELEQCVEHLKVDTAEVKQYLAQAANEGRNPKSVSKTLHLLMKTLPCKSLDELDWLLDFVVNHSLQWTEYIKLQGGTDFDFAIKTIMNTIMERSVQKKLSWTGVNSKKPSLKFKYKRIIDGIHVAMKEQFKDYTIVRGEARMQSILRNAARNN